MVKPLFYEIDNETYTLMDSVEMFALEICKDIQESEAVTADILQKCKVLNSLTNALKAINADT